MVSLCEFFADRFAPIFLVGARPKTFRAYREALSHWRAITEDPALDEITTETLARFKSDLLAGEVTKANSQLSTLNSQLSLPGFEAEERIIRQPLARATVNKHLRAIGAILTKAGPPGPANRDAIGLLLRVPWIKPLKEPRRIARVIEPAVIVRTYLAAQRARYPKHPDFSAPHFWKAIIVVALTTGLRRQAILGLRPEWIDWRESVVRIGPEADKAGQERVKPLHRVVLFHLVRIRCRGDRVFPWPHSERTWYRTWHRLQDWAGLEGEHFKLHDLKRTCLSTLANRASPWVAQFMGDHSTIRTTQGYVNPIAAVRPAIDAFPLPAEFWSDVHLQESDQAG